MFDPPPSSTPNAGTLSVGQLASLFKEVLTAAFPQRLRVVGEISNLSDRNHWYFSLKDDEANVSCVMWASAARRVGFPVENGMQVVLTGRVDFYPAQGRLQMYADALEPVGQGPLELQLRKLMEELREAGYFAQERKRRIRPVPRRVAVVTSRSAAALQDVIDTARRRLPSCELVLVDVRVQGDQAAPQIVRALDYLSEIGEEQRIDAVILTRGGGSIEDLWAFNERSVAEAVYRCRVPVVAAIGHETDTTVAELVADHRCATPTQAAMHVLPDAATLDQQLNQLRGRLDLLLQRQVRHDRQRLEAAARHTLFARPDRLLTDARHRVDTLAARLHMLPARRVETARTKLEALHRQLESLHPHRVLDRGYTLTTDAKGNLLRTPAAAERAGTLVTRFAEGEVTSHTNPPPRPRPRKRSVQPAAEPALFRDLTGEERE